MKFYSSIIFICIANFVSISFADALNSYKSLSYSQGLQIFSNAYGIPLNHFGGDLTGSFKMKNCTVNYYFERHRQFFNIEVKKDNENHSYTFWSYFRSGIPTVGGLNGTPVLPLIQMNKVTGFVALNRVGIDCETQGCWHEQTVRLFIRPESLVIQDVGPEPSPYVRPSVETVVCSKN